jgi:2-C-methyl-D-erythritol 4-phosphate cytidylyltransferase
VSIRKIALIVAGGSGNRLKGETPKQFVRINGKPMLMHTIEAFRKNDHLFEFVIVLPSSQMEYWKSLCCEYSFEVPHTAIAGGNTRFHSVKNGLKKVGDEGIVFIHDGVRPLVSSQTIDNCFSKAVKKGNALPVISPSESLREVTGKQNRYVNRNRYFLVQTPQTFKASLIKKAYSRRYQKEFTDDASVLESMGYSIHLVAGNRDNIKVTYPEDLKVVETIMARQNLPKT